MRKLKTKRDVQDFVNSLTSDEAEELCRLLEGSPPFRDIVVMWQRTDKWRKREGPWPLTREEILAMRL